MKSAIAAVLAACLGLSGCGNDTQSFAAARAVKTAVADRLPGAGNEKTKPVTVTRELLSQIPTPVQRVTIERTNQQALIASVAANQGVETWSSVDKVTISFRNGVIVATRGLGNDLMAAQVPGIQTLSGASTPFDRVHTTLDGIDTAVQTSYTCRITERTPQIINIIDISYNTLRVRESCSGAEQSFRNEYWIDGAQKIRRSRQWIGPVLEYITVDDLRP